MYYRNIFASTSQSQMVLFNLTDHMNKICINTNNLTMAADDQNLSNGLVNAIESSTDTDLNELISMVQKSLSIIVPIASEHNDHFNLFLNPVISFCIERILMDDTKWRLADVILAYIFVEPTSADFNMLDLKIPIEDTFGDNSTWKIRCDGVVPEFYGLISMLVNVCDKHVDCDTKKRTIDNTLPVMTVDIFRYIKMIWLPKYQPNVKSSNKT